MDDEFVTQQLQSLAYRFRRSVEFTAAEVDAAAYLRSVLPTNRYFPPAGGWALEYQAIAVLVDHILSTPTPVRVLELGSGVSTVWLAHALASTSAGGSITSLEQDVNFADKTRAMLSRYGLSGVCDVLHSPLVTTKIHHGERLWYDLSALDSNPFDILLVDGPFAGEDHQIRYPALPLLNSRLTDGALILVDDTDRPGEAEVVRLWHEDFPGDQLQLITSLRGSMHFRYRKV